MSVQSKYFPDAATSFLHPDSSIYPNLFSTNSNAQSRHSSTSSSTPPITPLGTTPVGGLQNKSAVSSSSVTYPLLPSQTKTKPFTPPTLSSVPSVIPVPIEQEEVGSCNKIRTVAKVIFKVLLAFVFHSANPGFFLASYVFGIIFSEEAIKRIDLIKEVVKQHLLAITPIATFATLFYLGIFTPPPHALLLGSILFAANLGAESAKRYYAWRDTQPPATYPAQYVTQFQHNS